MARIIPLPPNRHQQVQSLLPWYVTGKLDPLERARVEAHLAACPECRAEVEAERRLDAEVAGLSLDLERGWAHMRRRIVAGEARRLRFGLGSASLVQVFGRRRTLGWAIGLQSLAILTLIVALTSEVRAPRYVALGAPRPTSVGDAIVIFRPQTSEAAMRHALTAVGARIVDGPTTADAYVLAIPAAGLPSALQRLRLNAQVQMAEPIDAGAGK